MTRRRSRLDAVLRVRRLQEERAKGELLRAHGEEAHALEVAHHRRTIFLGLPAAPTDALRPEAFLTDRAVRTLAATTVVSAVTDARVATEHRTGRHAAWSDAAQRAGAISRLAARQREALRLDALRAEQAAADEIAVARWAREAR